MEEMDACGEITDPKLLREQKRVLRGPGVKVLEPVDELLLLSLHAECARRPILDYIQELHLFTGKLVSATLITT